MSFTIAIACDHAGYEYKEYFKEELNLLGYQIKDFGTNSKSSVDYPDYIHPLAKSVESKECELGIIICGSGNGVNITANKHAGIRSAMAWNTELASLARQHNDANVLALSARFIAKEYAFEICRAFLNAEFEGGRHQLRVNKIACG
jgi:ribose 5-phosphate isomerase B